MIEYFVRWLVGSFVRSLVTLVVISPKVQESTRFSRNLAGMFMHVVTVTGITYIAPSTTEDRRRITQISSRTLERYDD